MTTIYQTHAASYIEIDGEGNDLVCTIPSERDMNKRYTVSCIEHDHSVEVVSCNCLGHRRWGHCKHADICQAFWAKIYKSNQEKIAVKAEQEVKAEAEAAVREAEKIVTAKADESTTIQPISAPKRDMMKAALTTNRGFSLMR